MGDQERDGSTSSLLARVGWTSARFVATVVNAPIGRRGAAVRSRDGSSETIRSTE